MPNKYKGFCLDCNAFVAPSAGVAVLVDTKWSTYCAAHKPRVQPAPRAIHGQMRTSDSSIQGIGQELGHGKPAPDATITLRHSGDKIQIRPVGYLSGDLFESYRSACGGASYAREERCNYATIDLVGAIVTRLVAAGFRLDADPGVTAAVQAWEARAKADTSAADERAREIDAALRARGLALFPFQAQGVSWLAPLKSAILADSMGLGKSAQALMAMPAGPGVLVVCPAVAKGVWRRECATWRTDLTPVLLSGRGSFRWPATGELLVINYDLLPVEPMTADERTETQNELDRLARLVDDRRAADLRKRLDEDDRARELAATAPPDLVIVADEAHVLKGPKTQRTRRFRAIAKAARKHGGRTWLLTATPLLNRPTELWSLLQTIDCHNVVFGSYPNFKRLCGAVDGQYGTTWESSGIDTARVAPKLREVMLRRLKTDVLSQLPAKVVEVIDVDLDAQTIKRLDAITAELAAQGIDLAGAVAAAKQHDSIAFELIAKARAMLALAKTAHAMDMADDLEDAGEPVVVFSSFRAPVAVFGERDGWATITGDTSPDERTRIAERFQAGELKGVAGTIAAMGVAITLTRSSNVIMIDSDWTPALNEQAEDRCHRIGTSRTVNVRYLQADHPIDARLFTVCAIKRGMVARTVDAAAHRDGPLAERTDASAALDGARASADHAQRQRDNEELADKVRKARAAADADSTRRKATVKAERANVNRGWRIAPELFETPARAAASAAELWAVTALETLAALDGDYAQQQNGMGFSQADTYLGHAMATAARGGALSDGEWLVALQILVKYARQIGVCPQ